MGASHTPSPWHARPTENGLEWDVVSPIENSEHVFFVAVTFDGVGGHRSGEANARLASAAPDLFELLVEASTLGDRLLDDIFGYDWLTKMHAALAKARGEL